MPRPYHVEGNFFDYLLAANRGQLNGWRRWLLQPGMLFRSRQQWWGSAKPRPTPHEGLDLWQFEDTSGQKRHLDGATVIPAPFAGQILHIIDDFLGQSIFLAQDTQPGAEARFFLIVGHASPLAGLEAGQRLPAGEALATISAPVGRTNAVPPHLHLTVALIPDAINVTRLHWVNLGSRPGITLLDPLEVFPTAFVLE